MMPSFSFADSLLEKWPRMTLGVIRCAVRVEPSSELLVQTMNERAKDMQATLSTEQIGQLPAISASRKAYRALGKDPARYRLSAEALLRRVVKGEALYHINNVVDCLNLLSFTSGFSIGGYDADTIQDSIQMSVGTTDDLYEGLGRGVLNIDSLPVLRDGVGPFGSPTSDSVRTGVTPETTSFLMVVFDFGNSETLPLFLDQAVLDLQKWCSASNFETSIQTSK